MAAENLFSIGRAANISGVSTKTLRYYESLGLIEPKKVSDGSGYRYYDRENLLLIPVIKYYRQIGLDLKRIKELISKTGCANHYHYLEQEIEPGLLIEQLSNVGLFIKTQKGEILLKLYPLYFSLLAYIQKNKCSDETRVAKTLSRLGNLISYYLGKEER